MLQVRPAGPDDRDAVCRLLHEKMNARVPLEIWRSLTDCRWAPAASDYGVLALHGGAIVGFLGVVHAEREIAGARRRCGNLTSWYIEKPYRGRGLGLEMLHAAIADPAVTYTTFSSNPPAIRLVKKAGLELLDEERLIWRRRSTRAPAKSEILTDPKALAARLEAEQRQVLHDHAGLNVRPYLIQSGSGETCLVVLHVKKKGADIAYHEVLSVSDAEIFTRHVRDFADEILPDGQAVLAVDRRFLTASPDPDQVEAIPAPRYYRPARLLPRQVDFLYSEIVLLDLKI